MNIVRIYTMITMTTIRNGLGGWMNTVSLILKFITTLKINFDFRNIGKKVVPSNKRSPSDSK
jgi:hypothetical protein